MDNETEGQPHFKVKVLILLTTLLLFRGFSKWYRKVYELFKLLTQKKSVTRQFQLTHLRVKFPLSTTIPFSPASGFVTQLTSPATHIGISPAAKRTVGDAKHT